MKDVGKFYGRLVFFTAILVYFVGFSRFGMCTKKNLATL
jgi:hypothetical protein